MIWINSESQLPTHNQWVVIPFNGGFKVGRYDEHHPFTPAIVDRAAGKFYHGFQIWMGIPSPEVKP